jgi:hypothetical protein
MCSTIVRHDGAAIGTMASICVHDLYRDRTHGFGRSRRANRGHRGHGYVVAVLIYGMFVRPQYGSYYTTVIYVYTNPIVHNPCCK